PGWTAPPPCPPPAGNPPRRGFPAARTAGVSSRPIRRSPPLPRGFSPRRGRTHPPARRSRRRRWGRWSGPCSSRPLAPCLGICAGRGGLPLGQLRQQPRGHRLAAVGGLDRRTEGAHHLRDIGAAPLPPLDLQRPP